MNERIPAGRYPGQDVLSMRKTRHTTDQVIEKLREADVALAKGQKVPEMCKALGINKQTYYRWRQKCGGWLRQSKAAVSYRLKIAEVRNYGGESTDAKLQICYGASVGPSSAT